MDRDCGGVVVRDDLPLVSLCFDGLVYCSTPNYFNSELSDRRQLRCVIAMLKKCFKNKSSSILAYESKPTLWMWDGGMHNFYATCESKFEMSSL